MKPNPEDTFTNEELLNWINSVGGIGAKVVIPPDAYYIIGDALIKHEVKPYNPIGKIVEILGVVNKGFNDHNVHVKFQAGEANHTYLARVLWHGMRDLKPTQTIVSYPHKCKRCGSPARKGNQFVFCSNVQCKSWKQFKTAVGIKNIKSDKNYILCPVCGTNAIARKFAMYKTTMQSFFCGNSHEFRMLLNVGMIVNRIAYVAAKGGAQNHNTNVRWTGCSWEKVGLDV